MSTLIPVVGLIILLAISKFGEISSYAPVWKFSNYLNRNNRDDYIEAFDELGFARIKGHSDPTTSTLINLQENDSSDNTYAGLTRSYTTWNESIVFDHLEEYLEDLHVLSLEKSRLRNLSSTTFMSFSDKSIAFLNLRYTDIEIVAEDTLQPVQSTLKVLDLGNAIISMNDLIALIAGLCTGTTEDRFSFLSVLSLGNLGLRTIPYKALTYVRYSLQALSLFGNDFRVTISNRTETMTRADFEDIESNSVHESATDNQFGKLLAGYDLPMEFAWATFPVMPFLTELDLRNCNINTIEKGSFKNLANLKKLFISGNNILVLQDFAFEGLNNLATLDISFNRYMPNNTNFRGMIFRSESIADLHSLRTLNLSYSVIHPMTLKHLNRTPQSLTTLDLSNGRITNLEDGIFRELQNLQFLDLSGNMGLGPDLNAAVFKGLNMLQELHLSRTSLKSVEPLKELSSLRLLDVKHNVIENAVHILDGFPLLEYLDLSDNYINSWGMTRISPNYSKLQGIFLKDNVISLMTEEMSEYFKSLSNLSLANNNFVCNCQLKYFMEYLITSNNNSIENLPLLIDYETNGTNYKCTEASMSISLSFDDTDKFCVVDSTQSWLAALHYGIYIALLVIVCSLSVGGLIYWKWWYIRYVAVFIKNATVMSMINVENCEDRIYMYDIFVSYADQNRNWVIEELIPNLECPETRFSICLHERDFQVGVSILENIITGMDQSRTILLIISGCFLKSQWCQFEMHLAQHRLLETCREELVLVLLEEIPRRRRPKLLHYLMTVKTYIVWPKDVDDSNGKKLFWKRLRRAITANKSKRTSLA